MRATLTYHSIDETGSAISIRPETWRAHFAWLTSGRVRVVPLDDLVADAAGGDAVSVVFDDGFANVRQAVDDLASHGVPATVFVVTGHVGGTNAWGGLDDPGVPTWPLLTWGDLERLMAKGVTIGAHTRRHTALTTLSDAALDEELAGSASDLDERLGVRPRHLAYPYGDVDAAVAARAAAHFPYAHTTRFRPLSPADDARRLPRLDMYYFQRPGALEAWGSAPFARHVFWCRARRAIGTALRGGARRRALGRG